MPRKKTHEEFVEEMKVKNSNIKILGKYKTAKEKVECLCSICKHEWEATPSSLSSGRGCPRCNNQFKRTHEQFVSEMSTVNPDIEIIGLFTTLKSKILVRCKKCGREWHTTPANLLKGCGCSNCFVYPIKTHEVFINEMGVVNSDIEILGKYNGAKEKILCKSKICGHEWFASPTHLLNGEGCPRCKQSIGEKTIRHFLEKHNITYTPQYKYDDLFGVNGGLLSFDFYLHNENILIEYQGEQHYKITRFKNDVSIQEAQQNLIKQQEHDNRKREYAKSHNINLLEIPYWDFKNIEQILESRLLKQSA